MTTIYLQEYFFNSVLKAFCVTIAMKTGSSPIRENVLRTQYSYKTDGK